MRKSIFFTLLFVAPLLSFAQYTGPNANKTRYTIAEVEANAKQFSKEDKLFTLEGYVTEKLADKYRYMFKDETGILEAEIEPDNLPHRPFDEKDKVIVICMVKAKKTNLLIVSKTIVVKPFVEPMPAKPKLEAKPEKDEPASEMNEMDVAKPEAKEIQSEEIMGNKEEKMEEEKEDN